MCLHIKCVEIVNLRGSFPMEQDDLRAQWKSIEFYFDPDWQLVCKTMVHSYSFQGYDLNYLFVIK